MPAGVPAGGEFVVDSTTECLRQSEGCGGRGWRFCYHWGQKDPTVVTNGWDISLAPYTSGGEWRRYSSSLNTFVYGDQFAPKISSL